jgi:hypothetical protein
MDQKIDLWNIILTLDWIKAKSPIMKRESTKEQ